jgi:hypothetical protein
MIYKMTTDDGVNHYHENCKPEGAEEVETEAIKELVGAACTGCGAVLADEDSEGQIVEMEG